METKFEQLAKIFPEVITEKNFDGKIKKAVDFDKLKNILSENISDAPESYNFTWVGKNSARAEAYRKIDKTLRPCVEESKNFDTTENLYIEGDNLEVLKLLQHSYLHKVKMIYIDPPYNTGNDFIYRDNFQMDKNISDEQTELFDDDGNKNFKENPESNPRFHSDWCSMIYSRLLLARNLLKEDGVIFISIDDNEQANLKKICDEVFGERNFVGKMTLLSNPRGSQNSKNLSYVHEYLMMYSKIIDEIKIGGISKSEESLSEFNETDSDGRKYRLLGLRKRGGAWRKEERPNMFYPIYVNPNNGECSLEKTSEYIIEVIPKRPTGELSRWTWGKDKFQTEKNFLIGKKINRSTEVDAWDIFRKDYKDNIDGTEKTTKLKTIWIEKETNYQNAKNEIKELFGNSEMFDFPKPTYIVKRLASIVNFEDGDIILDFFSGSATTAHAVMQLNSEDGGQRKFIMVQLPEVCGEKTEAYKAGYKNICEIGKERIRRAGEKIKSESPLTTENLDVGFRVLKVADTNFKNISVSPAELTQEMLKDFIDNIKSDRNGLDLVFECLINWGVELHFNYTQEKFEGATIHIYDEDALIACFDKNISLEAVKIMAQKKPLRAVFRDACFSRDDQKINAAEIFKFYSPNTKFKVI